MILVTSRSDIPDSVDGHCSVTLTVVEKGKPPIAFSSKEKVILDFWQGWNWGKTSMVVQNFAHHDAIVLALKRENNGIESIRKSVSQIAGVAKNRKKILLNLLSIEKISLELQISSAEFLQAVVEGVLLACYRFDQYKTLFPDGKFEVQELVIAHPDDLAIQMKMKEMIAICESVYWARNLGNEPANVVNPQYCKQWNEKNAKEYSFTAKHLDKKQMQSLGMHGILGVNQGSYNDPYLVIGEYLPIPNETPILLVGKGVTFDTGGISIKPANGMWEMKMDMSGAGAVLSVIAAVARLQWRVNLVVVAPCVENMPGGHAQRPGDILKMYNGKTVEVDNTDAEGRLILGDALWYGLQTYKPKYVIDVATLTGACVVALGEHVAGLYATTKELQEKLIACGKFTGEECWAMPLFPEYDKLIKSSVADIKNAGPRYAGSITAAKFLQHFVDPQTPWVHLDIAGPAMTESPSDYKPTKGATGFGVRLLLHLLQQESFTK